MRHSSIGLRARLLLLVLFAVVPAFGLIGYTAITQYRQAALEAERDALTLVRLAGRQQDQLIAATRQLLIGLAQVPALRQRDSGTHCHQLLAEMLKEYYYYTNFGVAALDGRVFCSALPMTRPIDISDRDYFRRAALTGEFTVGDYQVGRITGIHAINFGYPVFNASGNMQAVVYAALSLSWLNHLIADLSLPVGSTVIVVDGQGTILARHPEPEKWVGKSTRGSQLIDAIREHQSEGTISREGLDGVDRLYGFAPLHVGNVRVAVGIPKAVAFAPAKESFIRNIALLFLVATLALIAAWAGSDVFVLRRIHALAAAARRLAKGDMSARSGLPHGTEELGRLAHDFDAMASALQKVNRALKTLSAGNRTLVRAVDERALLESMCRVIVDVGGYRFAWVGYAEQDEHKTLRPVAQQGFEGGLDALAGSLGALTWADTERGGGPAANAIRTGAPCVSQNMLTDTGFAPWREEARRYGYASGAAFPLRVGEETIGALAIAAREPDAFDTEELELLGEAAEDLAFGIATLRTRAQGDRARATIQRLAHYDQLTGLPNHVQLEERLRRALWNADTNAQSLALVVLDINRLREINDALGFHHGDLLLKDIGARIRGLVTEDISVARLRGDEFALLVPAGDAERVTRIACQVLSALREPFAVGNLNLTVEVSAGISLFPQHGVDGAHLLRCADVAVQQAKKSGKEYVFYSTEQDANSKQRLALVGDLRHAIEAGELVLYYQPKIDIPSGRVCGAEALVRWAHPTRGMIRPDEFISLAEHTGLIKPLTDWVMGAALRQSAAWRALGLEVPVAINLSTRNLRDPELLNKFERLVVDHGARTDWLEMEITEGAVMEDPEGALAILTRLSDMGVKLFIDDFGTGYSSLGYLKKLPVDAIKIDKSFVLDMLTSADSAAIVRSTIDLAHALGMKVVAEGVESQTILDRLKTKGCDVAQGYHFSKPLPPEQLVEWFNLRAKKAG